MLLPLIGLPQHLPEIGRECRAPGVGCADCAWLAKTDR